MSGIELAPVALKLFPVLLKALDDRLRIFEGMDDWWNFGKTYKSFLRSIRLESVRYKQNIRIFVSLSGLDMEEYGNLHESPDSTLWHDPTIRAQLMRTIDKEKYELFLDQLKIINDTLTELVAKIERPDSGTVKGEIYRIKFSFDRSRPTLLSELVTANSELFHILDQDSLIAHHVKDPGHVKSWKKLQLHARALYDILDTSLKCLGTTHTHNCSLSAEWTQTPAKGVHTPFLKVLFDQSSGWQQLRWDVEVLEISLQPETGLHSGVSGQEVISRAVLETRQREWHEDLVEHGKRHAVGIATAAATLAILAPATSRPDKLWTERTRNKLKRKMNILGGKDSATNKPVPDDCGKNGQSGAPTAPETKPSKSVGFTDLPSSTQTSVNEGVGLQHSPISDMCAFLRSPTPGRVKGDTGHTSAQHVAFHLEPDDQSSLQGSSRQTLADFIRTTPRLPDRIRLGLYLVRAVVSYGESGWVPPPLNREKVFVFLDRNGDKSKATPYLTHDSLPQTLRMKRPVDSQSFCEDVLFSLGVILLELADGKTLEQTVFWTGSLGDLDMRRRSAVAGWRKDLQQRQPDGLCEPIRRCLNTAFGSFPRLEDHRFLEDVFNEVVSPLEEFLLGWRDRHFSTR